MHRVIARLAARELESGFRPIARREVLPRPWQSSFVQRLAAGQRYARAGRYCSWALIVLVGFGSLGLLNLREGVGGTT